MDYFVNVVVRVIDWRYCMKYSNPVPKTLEGISKLVISFELLIVIGARGVIEARNKFNSGKKVKASMALVVSFFFFFFC